MPLRLDYTNFMADVVSGGISSADWRSASAAFATAHTAFGRRRDADELGFLDLPGAVDVDTCDGADRRDRGRRHDADLHPRVERRELHLEPALEAPLVRPDGADLGAGVAGDHGAGRVAEGVPGDGARGAQAAAARCRRIPGAGRARRRSDNCPMDEHSLHALANQLGEPIVLVDQTGVVAMASQRATEHAGAEAGMRFRDLFSNPVEAEALIANAEATAATRVLRRRGDDAVLLGCTAFRVDQHVVVQLSVGGAADMRAIAAHVDDALFCEELAPDGSRRTLYFGGGARSLLGDQVLAASDPAAAWDAAILPDDRAARMAAIEDVRSGKRASVEYHLVDAHGVPHLLYERSWPDTGSRSSRAAATASGSHETSSPRQAAIVATAQV